MSENVYVTSDFQNAVYLLCNNAVLTASNRSGPNRLNFIFADKAKCEALIAKSKFEDIVSLNRALAEIKKTREIIRSTP
jgi:hypothetical protein